MTAKRKKNKHLPERVYNKHGAYYFVDKNNKWYRLGKTLSEAMIVWSKFIEKPQDIIYMSHLFDRYMTEIAPLKSEKSYKNNLIEIQPLRIAFSHMQPHELQPVDIYQYLDVRGKKTPVAANREKSLLSHIFTTAIRWGVVNNNPCFNVRKLVEKKRNRYITDEEFQAVYSLACPFLKSLMMFAYLTGLRQGDILKLKWIDISENGIFVHINKTQNPILIEWTNELQLLVSDMKKIRNVNSKYLFCTLKGTAYTTTGFTTLWQRLLKKALSMQIINNRFRFHDIRRKTATDMENKFTREKARKLLGHADQKTTQRYISGTQKVKPLQRPDLIK